MLLFEFLYSGSHVLIYWVKTYPEYNLVNIDKLDFAASLKNLDSIANAPNYKFIKVTNLSRKKTLNARLGRYTCWRSFSLHSPRK